MRGARSIILAAALAALAPAVSAEDLGGVTELTKQGKYEEVRDDLKNAIVNRGYVVDYVGQFNAMLERTSEVVGSVTESGAKSPYKNAEYMQFCAAKLTHDAISANPQNIVNCPYVVFVYELGTKPDVIHVGYRKPVAGPSKRSREAVDKIEALLADIAKEAAGK